MGMFIDPETKSFYNSEIVSIPEGYIEIPYDYYRELVDGRASGKVIEIVDSWPVLADPPPPEITPDQMLIIQSAKLQGLIREASEQKNALSARIETLQDAIDLDISTDEEVAELPVRQAQLTEWKRYAVYLGRVPQQSGWPLVVEWPSRPAEGIGL